MGVWSELPVDLVNVIDQKLFYFDKVRSRCVCTHWNSSVPKLPDLRQQPPYLLVPYKDGSLCGLYDPFDNKMFKMKLPEAGEKVFKGSGHGWVVTAQHDGSIDLFNLLSRVQFALPCNVAKNPICKIALSCKPTSSNFIAVAFYRRFRFLAYCKIGDRKWYDLEECDGICRMYQDIAFCGRKLYALTVLGELMVCDDIVSYPKLKSCVPAQDFVTEIFGRVHLVNSSSGGIMAVVRVEEWRKDESQLISKTVGFEIYKLDLSSSKWLKVKSLGAREILFMGLGQQFGVRGTKGNQIYFSDDKLYTIDNGIFDFGDKTIKPLEYKANLEEIYPLPIWVTLNPH